MSLFLDSQICPYLCQYHPGLVTVALYIFWNRALGVLQFCSSFSKLFWLFEVTCNSIWIIGSACINLWNKGWNSDRDFMDSIGQFGEYCHLSSTEFSDPWIGVYSHYLDSLTFSALFCSVWYTCLILPWWDLFLSTFILFNAVVSGMVFLILLSGYLFLW